MNPMVKYVLIASVAVSWIVLIVLILALHKTLPPIFYVFIGSACVIDTLIIIWIIRRRSRA
jgi:hypothetical protein